MRDDMFEVIIERPRHASRARFPRKLRRRDAAATRHDPERLGFAAGLHMTDKSLSENLSPLRRYLERQIDRPWDRVWSDISARLKPDSTVQQHVRDHVEDFVAIKTFIKDGVVWAAGDHRFYSQPHTLKESRTKLFVDPRSGLLRQNKYFQTRRQQEAAKIQERARRMREISPTVQIHRFGKHRWWKVVLAPTRFSRHNIKNNGVDVVYRAGFSSLSPANLYGRDGVYAIAKRQLSKKEIARVNCESEAARLRDQSPSSFFAFPPASAAIVEALKPSTPATWPTGSYSAMS
jgi:hypothetical protein